MYRSVVKRWINLEQETDEDDDRGSGTESDAVSLDLFTEDEEDLASENGESEGGGESRAWSSRSGSERPEESDDQVDGEGDESDGEASVE